MFYQVTDCKKVKDPKPDESEFPRVETVDINYLKGIVEKGEITNADAANRPTDTVELECSLNYYCHAY